jgi:hypothetical protein
MLKNEGNKFLPLKQDAEPNLLDILLEKLLLDLKNSGSKFIYWKK